jgi:hypothetical protein
LRQRPLVASGTAKNSIGSHDYIAVIWKKLTDDLNAINARDAFDLA